MKLLPEEQNKMGFVNNRSIENLYYLSLIVAAFSISIHWILFLHYLPILFWLIALCQKKVVIPSIKLFFNNKESLFFVFLLLYASWELFSLTYTSNMSVGIKAIEKKLPIILISLMCIFPVKGRENRDIRTLLDWFSIGATVSLVCIVAYTFFSFWHGHSRVLFDAGLFKSSILGAIDHNSYVSILLILACYHLYRRGYENNRVHFFCISIILISVALVFMASSGIMKIGLIGLIFFELYTILFARIHKYKRIISIVLCTAVAALICVGAHTIQNKIALYKNSPSVKTRTEIWSCAFAIVKQNPVFGLGIGDVEDTMVVAYKEKYPDNRLYKFNSHNQYIQTTLGSGTVGLIFLLTAFVIAISMKSKFLRVFIFLYLIFCFVECVFVRNFGTIPFAFLLLMLGTSSELNVSRKDWECKVLCSSAFVAIVSVFVLCIYIWTKWNRNPTLQCDDPHSYGIGRYEIQNCSYISGTDSILQNSKAYVLDSTASGFTWTENTAIHETFLGAIDGNKNKKYLISVYCFVTNDFNGRTVDLVSTDGAILKRYNAGIKNTWQKLELTTSFIGYKRFVLRIHTDNGKGSMQDLKGKVMFSCPKMEEL